MCCGAGVSRAKLLANRAKKSPNTIPEEPAASPVTHIAVAPHIPIPKQKKVPILSANRLKRLKRLETIPARD